MLSGQYLCEEGVNNFVEYLTSMLSFVGYYLPALFYLCSGRSLRRLILFYDDLGLYMMR